jgi:hypothetical protein
MATQTHVTLIDDIDGSSAVETVAFGLDGADYEIDLNEKNAKKLRDVLANYTANARQVGGRRNRSRSARVTGKAARSGSSKEQLSAIRDWARSQGYEVSDRGRLSAAVVQAFEDAH